MGRGGEKEVDERNRAPNLSVKEQGSGKKGKKALACFVCVLWSSGKKKGNGEGISHCLSGRWEGQRKKEKVAPDSCTFERAKVQRKEKRESHVPAHACDPYKVVGEEEKEEKGGGTAFS